MIQAIKAGIPTGPLDTVSIATKINRFQPIYESGTDRTRKLPWFDTFWAVSSTERAK
jgi:hypothetical protein